METTPSAVPSYIASIVRNLLAVASGFVVGKGWIDAEQGVAITGAIMAVIPVTWSLVQKHNANKALKSAINSPAGHA